jgi:cation diffusion facilitator family transporter
LTKVKVASLSVLSNTILVIFKLIVGLSINSVSVLSEAIHSGLDLVAALIALFAVSKSSKPPDEEHRYGHGKIENVSGVIEAILIFAASIWIIREAAIKLAGGAQVGAPLWGLIVMGVSALSNWLVSSLLFKTARETDSVALEADALHLRTDVYTSLGVTGGLLLLWITGIHLFDPLIAIGVALLIIKASYQLTVKSFSPLLDSSLPADEEEGIKEIIDGFTFQVIGFHQLRTRKAGSQRFVDLHLVAPQYLKITVSHDICDGIEREIKDRYPGTQVLIHVEPCRIGDDCPQCGERSRCEISGKSEKKKGIKPSEANKLE